MTEGSRMTVSIPKVFLAYLWGLFVGGLLTAGICLTAIHAFNAAPALIFFGAILVVISSLITILFTQ